MKQISLNSIRVILEVCVIKNPTRFSRWSVRIYVKHIESKYDLTSEELAEKIKEYLWRDKEI